MHRLFHIADLHLCVNEKDYGFCVLNEILQKAKEAKADSILFSGDSFDSFKDFDELHEFFVKTLKNTMHETCIFILLGNHEYLNIGKSEIKDFSEGNIHFIKDSYALFPLNIDAEILLIPHNYSIEALSHASKNEETEHLKKSSHSKKRIIAAHGSLADSVYLGPEGETEGENIFEASSFLDLGADYVALGHIHSPSETIIKNVPFVYSGSASLFRKGEEHAHQVVIVDIEKDQIHYTKEVIKSAGIWKRILCEVNGASSIEGAFAKLNKELLSFSKVDAVSISFSGFIETEQALSDLKNKIAQDILEKKVRKLDFETDEILIYESLSSDPLVKVFVDAWQKEKDQNISIHGKEVVYKALYLGLGELKTMLEARK